MNQIEEQKTRSIEMLYALMASLGAVGVVSVLIVMFTRSLTCC
jgi:hypothetical protein